MNDAPPFEALKSLVVAQLSSRSEEHTSELQSPVQLVCRLLLEKKIIPFFLGLLYSSRISLRGRSAASLRQDCVTVFSFAKNHFSSPSGRWSIVLLISSWGSTL